MTVEERLERLERGAKKGLAAEHMEIAIVRKESVVAPKLRA